MGKIKGRPRTELANFLEEYRQQNNLSKRKLAEICGISDGTIRRIIKKGEAPGIDTLQTIAEALGYDVVELFKLAVGQEYQKGMTRDVQSTVALLLQLSPEKQAEVRTIVEAISRASRAAKRASRAAESNGEGAPLSETTPEVEATS